MPLADPYTTRLVIRQSCGCRSETRLTIGHATRTTPSTLAHVMAEAAVTEAQHYELDELGGMSERLLAALDASVEQADDVVFNQALAEVLQSTETRGEDVHVWHAAILALQNEIERADTRPDLAQLDVGHWLNRAHLTISQQSRRQTTRALIHQMEMAERLA